MSDTYAKVFRTMFTGSMYGAGLHVFATWAWVLSHKDESGLVEVNPRLVAAELGAEVEQIDRAIEYLTTPDPESRSPEEEGRRMVRVGQFDFRVVNHARYRDRGSDRTEYWRQYRAKKRATVAQHPAQVAQPEITHADANADADTSASQRSARKRFVPPTVEDVRTYIRIVEIFWNSANKIPRSASIIVVVAVVATAECRHQIRRQHKWQRTTE